LIAVSIDPGKLCLPFCVWTDNVLTHAGMSVLPPGSGSANVIAAQHWANIQKRWDGQPRRVYVEQMSLNTGRDTTRGKAIRTGNDLLLITNIAATLASLMQGELVHVPISTWKGSSPKSVTRNRVLATLRKEEQIILHNALVGVRPSLFHNLYDAAGIGLWATRRYRLQR
jgi:hypothetical protein